MDILESVSALMVKNRRQVGEHSFTVPSASLYPFQWLWDSCFHAIILSHFDVPQAKRELLAVTAHPLPSGLLPHMIYWNTNGEPLPNWGRENRGDTINAAWKSTGSSTITQPPVLAQAILRVFRRDTDLLFLERIYPTLHRHLMQLAKDRTFNHDALVYIINPDESGEDNSPRFDDALGLPPHQTAHESLDKRIDLMLKNAECDFQAKTCMSQHFGVADVSFNALYLEDLRATVVLAEVLGKTDDVRVFQETIAAVERDMRKQLSVDGVFHSYDHIKKRLIPTLTWNIFMPLYAGLLSPLEAHELVANYLKNPDLFLTPYGVLTTARTEVSYDADDGFWRGPIWLAPHWFIYHGLQRYNFVDEAAEIRRLTENLILRSGYREHYHPDTGEGLGATDFTWGGLVLDMV